MFLFGLLTWLYVVVIQVSHPSYLPTALSHINVFPLNLRVDLTGILGFGISAVGFFLWQLSLQQSDSKSNARNTGRR
jgi:hypothetical protein